MSLFCACSNVNGFVKPRWNKYFVPDFPSTGKYKEDILPVDDEDRIFTEGGAQHQTSRSKEKRISIEETDPSNEEHKEGSNKPAVDEKRISKKSECGIGPIGRHMCSVMETGRAMNRARNLRWVVKEIQKMQSVGKRSGGDVKKRTPHRFVHDSAEELHQEEYETSTTSTTTLEFPLDKIYVVIQEGDTREKRNENDDTEFRMFLVGKRE